MIDRRRLCLGTAAAAAVLATAGSGAAGVRKGVRRVPIRNLWTGETGDAVYWRDGAYDQQALAAYSHLMRDRLNGEVAPIFYGVLDQLFRLRRALDTDAPVGLVSGYRSPRTNETLRAGGEGVARNSLHTLGMAADVRFPGIPAEAAWRAAVALGMGGAGLYRRSDFVHLDVGPVRRWGG